MKIILLFPKWTSEYGIFSHFAKRASTWPPLNLAYLAAIAEDKGHEVKIIDGEAENEPLNKMIEQTIAFKPDIVGITAATPFYHIASNVAKRLKQRIGKTPIIIGGPHITMLKEQAFYPFFDYAFIGESEESWQMFLERYENGKDISCVSGILFRNGNDIKFTGDSEPIYDLTRIPFPARHLLKTDKYKIGTLQGVKTFTTVMMTRGCPFKCIFCSTKVFRNRVRKQPPGLVVDEITSVISKFNIRHFVFLDDTLTLDRNYVLQVCDMIDKEGLKITFEGSTRANLIDEELILRMARAGLIRISFGLESVNSKIREIIRKEVPLESYSTANRLTNKYGIETLNSVMIGLPGETIDTIKELLSYLKGAREIHQINCSIAMPYPGTELFEMAKREEYGLKLMTEDFSKFRRYGSAVMQVNDLSCDDLIRIQNDAFVSIYLRPWRIIPMLKKSGIIGGFLMLIRLMRYMGRRILGKSSI